MEVLKSEKTKVYLPDVLEDLKTIILESVHAKQQKLLIKMQEVVHKDIITDKLRLTQVLLNIISNAVKFTPVGGTVHILVEEKDSQKAGYAVYSFCIKDNESVCSKEFQEHVFDPFGKGNVQLLRVESLELVLEWLSQKIFVFCQ